jgi:gas vesicle protein
LDFIIRGTRPKADGAVAKIVFGTGIGMALGLIAGLLLAPRAGSDTRRMVAGNARDTAKILKKAIFTAYSPKHNPYTNDTMQKNSPHPADE